MKIKLVELYSGIEWNYNNRENSVQLCMRKVALIFSLWVVTVSSVFSSSPEKQIELLLLDSASGLASVAQVAFSDGTSPLYTASEDGAFVLQSPDNAPQLYSFSQDNVACSTNKYGPMNSTAIIRLGIVIDDSGTFIFSQQAFTNFDAASVLFLEDRQLNTFTDLRQSNYKVAIAQSGQINNRFFLHVTYPPSLTSSPAGCLNNDGIVFINADSSLLWSVCKLLDSTLMVVAVDTNVTGNFSFTGLPGGNYTVEFDYSVYTPQQSIVVDRHQLLAGLNVSNNHDRVFQDIQFFTASSNATQVNWDFGDGSTITGVANPTYFYLYPGVYTATVNCSNNYGCSVQADTLMYIDYATAVDNIDGHTVKIMNDNNSIRIVMNDIQDADYKYTIYNMEGLIVQGGSITNSNTLLDMSNAATGAYIVSIRSNTANLSQKVLITN